MTSEELAKLIHNGYPSSDLLPLGPDTDCASMETLREPVNQGNFGDTLLKFIVFELCETSVEEGTTNLRQAGHALDYAVRDVEAVRKAVFQAV